MPNSAPLVTLLIQFLDRCQDLLHGGSFGGFHLQGGANEVPEVLRVRIVLGKGNPPAHDSQREAAPRLQKHVFKWALPIRRRK